MSWNDILINRAKISRGNIFWVEGKNFYILPSTGSAINGKGNWTNNGIWLNVHAEEREEMLNTRMRKQKNLNKGAKMKQVFPGKQVNSLSAMREGSQ